MNYGSRNPHLCWTPLRFKGWSSFSLWFHGQNLIHCGQGRSPSWLRFPPSHAILLVQRRVASEKIRGHFDLPCRGQGITLRHFSPGNGQSPNLANWKKEVAIWVRIFNGKHAVFHRQKLDVRDATDLYVVKPKLTMSDHVIPWVD